MFFFFLNAKWSTSRINKIDSYFHYFKVNFCKPCHSFLSMGEQTSPEFSTQMPAGQLPYSQASEGTPSPHTEIRFPLTGTSFDISHW